MGMNSHTIASPVLERDAANVSEADAIERAWPAAPDAREKRFQAVIKRSVLNEIHRHGHSVDRVEVGGVLAGSLCRDEGGPFLYVESCLRGNFSTSQAAQVTFTAETWADIQDAMEREHPKEKILGWYHTHPGFGIFLSGMDLFIQENFFNLPWQIALVYDPVSGEEGVFIWRAGQTAPESFIVEEDVPAETMPTTGTVTRGAGVLIGDVDVEELVDRVATLEQRQKWMAAAIAVLGVIAIGLPLVLTLSAPDRRYTPAHAPASAPASVADLDRKP